MAGTQHTQTPPKFTWRFLALDIAGSHIIHITASTESEAREQSPADSLLVFAGRFPERGANHA